MDRSLSYIARSQEQNVHVLQGDCKVSADEGTILTTILGSCIAVCLYDTNAGCGGMNHFLLPDGEQDKCGRYGVYSMELLINELLKSGAQRDTLTAKVFGGARMVTGFHDIGSRNASFAFEFLETENIPCLAQSIGGTRARRIRFDPISGIARQQLLQEAPKEVTRVIPKAQDVTITSDGDLELL